MVGTLAYMPPERFKPNSPHSAKVTALWYFKIIQQVLFLHITNTLQGDLWSLGVTLVHLLQGKHPFSEKLGYWELRSCVATTPVEHILRHDDKYEHFVLFVIVTSPRVLFARVCDAGVHQTWQTSSRAVWSVMWMSAPQ